MEQTFEELTKRIDEALEVIEQNLVDTTNSIKQIRKALEIE